MKTTRFAAQIVIAMVVLCSGLAAQETKNNDDKPKPEAREEKPTPVKVQVVFTEWEGDKKVKSLPYTLLITVDHGPEWAKLRIGTRVPIYAGGRDGGMQYVDVGTNIDCRAHRMAAANFDVQLSFERSWLDGEVLLPFEKSGPATEGPALSQFNEPVIRQFKAELNLVMRDGQTVESTVATDPLSGKVAKIEVTFVVVK
jgi:hypothetical protein